jgi:hypothetical protein
MQIRKKNSKFEPDPQTTEKIPICFENLLQHHRRIWRSFSDKLNLKVTRWCFLNMKPSLENENKIIRTETLAGQCNYKT